MSRNALTRLLQLSGFDVSDVSTVTEGLALLSDDLDVVVLDLMLPDGDGADVLRVMRQRSIQARVIVTTAIQEVDKLHDILQLRPNLVMHKPINFPELLKHVRGDG